MDMIGKVRRMKLRDLLSISEISKRTGLSRNTVKKWLKADGDVIPQYRREVRPGKLKGFTGSCRDTVKSDTYAFNE